MKKFLIATAVFTSFLVGYGVIGSAWPGVENRTVNHGYFENDEDNMGTSVFPKDYRNGGRDEALPARINSAGEFIVFIEDKLNNGNRQEKTGAAFIIQTMIGGAQDRTPSAAAMDEWRDRVNYAQRNGLIDWRKNNHDYSVNSYYQGTDTGPNPNDDAFYYENDDADAIVFYDKNNRRNVLYAIKWECANPVGTLRALNEAGPEFDLLGHSEVDNLNPKPGDTINFSHFVGNAGPDSTTPTTIRWTTRGWIDSGAKRTIEGLQSMGVMSKRPETHLAAADENNYRVPVGTPAGTKICREIGWTPDTSDGGADWGRLICATVRYDYTLEPSVTVRINDGDTPGDVAEPGDKITFEYNVNNKGTTQSNDTACTTNGNSYSGYVSAPGVMGDVNDRPITCGNIEPGFHQVGQKDITAVANTTFCRSLTVSPATPTVASVTSDIVCVIVATKPYVKVYGGDVSVGGKLETSPGACERDADAGIIAWNKRDAAGAGWAGAGTQYAAMAMKTINDFGTTQMNNGAPAPSGLAFRNSDIDGGNQAAGLFGNGLGGASCMPDYYANENAVKLRTASTTTDVAASSIDFNLPSATTGTFVYDKTGGTDFTLNASSIKVNQKVILYVEGDLRITGNVIYEDNWTVTSAPLFQVVVRGNIYIDPSVSRLDGMYVAQSISGTDHTGEIYTCTDTGDSFTPMTLNGELLNKCDDTKLVVNGSMVADRLLLLRTLATVRSSTVDEPRGANAAAEVFNHSPINWITQPVAPGGAVDEYDSITSLPPIL